MFFLSNLAIEAVKVTADLLAYKETPGKEERTKFLLYLSYFLLHLDHDFKISLIPSFYV